MKTRKRHLLIMLNNKECEILVEFDGLEFIVQNGHNLDEDVALTDKEMDMIEQDELSQKWGGL